MFSLGQACDVSVRPNEVPVGFARLTNRNSLRLEENAKIRVKVGGNTLFLRVMKPSSCTDDRDRDNITIGQPIGGERKGFYKPISSTTFSLHKAWGTKKAKWSVGAVFVSIASATAASISAATKDCHYGVRCVGEIRVVTWALVALAALASIIAWCKDNEVF